MMRPFTTVLGALAICGLGLGVAGCRSHERDEGANVEKRFRGPLEAGGTDGESFVSDGAEGFGMYDGYTGSGGVHDGDDDGNQDREAHSNRDGDRAHLPGQDGVDGDASEGARTRDSRD